MTFGKKELATLVAEFLGTGVLTLLMLTIRYSTISSIAVLVALAAGLTVSLMSFAVSGTSGGHFNPALTLAMWTARKLDTVNGILYIAVQMLGGYGAYLLYTYFVNSTLQPVGGHFAGRILAAESVGAGIFAFGWAAAKYQRFNTATFSSVAGIAYAVGIVAASSVSIGLLNPAVALGIKAWVWGTYVLGPVIGAIIGVNLYAYLFAGTSTARTATVAATTTTAKKPAPKKSRAKK